MKDIIITKETQKKELMILVVCFILSFFTNIAGIVIYKTSWKELFTEIDVMLALTVVLYVLFLFLRGIVFLLKKMFSSKRKSSKHINSKCR